MFFSSARSTVLLLLSLSLNALAHSAAHEHEVGGALPGQWHFPDDHPVRALFARQSPVPPVGTPAWRALYPERIPDLARTPRAWIDSLNAAVAAGRIPNLPIPTDTGGNPAYPAGSNPAALPICSSAYRCRAPTDIWDSPNGTVGISFDDGPVTGHTERLLDFLGQQNQVATHFLIGIAIIEAPQSFVQTVNRGEDLAVHTWSHRHTSTLSNEAIVAEIGWTMQIIADGSGGRVPRFWRPPYGDSDSRVRAIANEIFGLTAVIWNQDAADWELTTGVSNVQQINERVRAWYNAPKSPGIMPLHHELTDGAVTVFIETWPSIIQHQWRPVSVARLVNGLDHNAGRAYWNADNGNQGAVSSLAIGDWRAINRLVGGSGLPPPPTGTTTSMPTPSTNTGAPNQPVTDVTVTSTSTMPGGQTSTPERAQSSAVSSKPFVGSCLLLLGLWSISSVFIL